MELKKIGPLSLAKIAAIIYAVVGLVVGIFATILTSLSADLQAQFTFYGATAIILLPIIYGITGFVGGALVALLYNFVASKIGGIELNLK